MDTDKALETLWRSFDTPINDDGILQAAFLGWPKGTHREVVWKWFDKSYSRGVAYLLNGLQSEGVEMLTDELWNQHENSEVSEHAFDLLKQWAGLLSNYDAYQWAIKLAQNPEFAWMILEDIEIEFMKWATPEQRKEYEAEVSND
jgi:hypothetical protein